MVLIKISCRFAALTGDNGTSTANHTANLHQINQNMMPNNKKVEKMTPADYTPTFGELYRALPESPKAPKQAFVEEIAELCMCSQQTVRMWIQGTQRPDALKRKLIAERLGYNEEQLFPSPICKQ
ncbi:helix-turn-helix domain-containing protein [Duncaniella muris]|uniref:helix-turn-helix domain-containing protein n=1 Tax=Duncaniella muris TaxID=2094150 RepID=UPI0025A646B7|nr:helix-turn-helix transcriptional regulator [Duncaniella muris]